MSIFIWKLVILFVLFFISFGLTLFPLKLVARLGSNDDPRFPSRHDRVVSLLSCFAGGVFMATGLLDLLPQVVEAFVQVKESMQLESRFPMAEFCVAMGFFLVLILEQLVVDCRERAHTQAVLVDVLSTEQEQQRLLRSDASAEAPLAEAHPAVRPLLLVAALSLHSLLEGLAIGLQQSATTLLQIAVAVVLHKAVVAFSLGLNLARTNLKVATTIWSGLIFSIMSPIGTAIGTGVSHFGRSAATIMITAVLEGLACGTFVYVTFFEVLPHELNCRFDRKLKLLMVIMGFTVVCGVLLMDV